MKKAYLNKVWLSWRPSHSSHITQPLDLVIFGPLKRYYRQETAGMETYEGTSKRQKQIFTEAYKVASEKAFSQENIRRGFQASGIYPVDADRAVTKLKPKECRRPTFQPPTTPPIQIEEGDDIFATPSTSHDIEKLLQRVDWSSENAQRDVRLILRKCGKSLEKRTAATAFQEKEIVVQRAKIAALKPLGRSRINFDPNKAFPDIQDLITHRDRAELNTWKLNNQPAAENRLNKRRKESTEEQAFFNRYPRNEEN
jgi:4-hydroxybenzoate polyprenyltransferase